MRGSALPLMIVALALSGPVAARADFTVGVDPNGLKFYDDLANMNVVSFTGTIGGQHSGPEVAVETTGSVDTGAGYANIKPDTGTLTSVTFTPTDPNSVNTFSFRGELESAGSVTLTVQDNQGNAAQTFTFSGLPANADIGRLGIIGSNGETIKSVTISNASFEEVKQVQFGLAPSLVPEPSSLALLGIGGGLFGLLKLRRRHRGRRMD